jgi:hypothetical protein
MTFNDMAEQCPELKQIKEEAKSWWEQDDRWEIYETLKACLKVWVGEKAIVGLPEFMYTRTAYDIAHKEIFS